MPVRSARVVDSSVSVRGYRYGMLVLVEPAEAGPDQLLVLSRWIEAHCPERLGMIFVDFFTDLQAIRIHQKQLSDTTDAEADFERALWAGGFKQNWWTRLSYFLYRWGCMTRPLSPCTRP